MDNSRMTYYLDSIISRASDLRDAIATGSISYPDGEVEGREELMGFLFDADNSLDDAASYYL